MPNSSLRCLAASLVLHVALVGVAGGGAPRTAWRAATPRAGAEAAVTLEAPGSSDAPILSPSENRAPGSMVESEEPPRRVRKVAPPPPPEPSLRRAVPRQAPRPAGSAPPAVSASSPTPEATAPSETGSQPPWATPVASAVHGEMPPTTDRSPGAPGLHGMSATGRGFGTGQATPGATGPGDARARLLSSYLADVRQRVSQHREYPYLARRANIEGTVCLRVVVAASGRVLGVTPTCGTHQRPLLDAALASVSNAAPFPPLPPALGQRLTVDVPVVFELDSM
jgi:protein TonB